MKMYNVEITVQTNGDICIEQEVGPEHKESVFISRSQILLIAAEMQRIYQEEALANPRKQ